MVVFFFMARSSPKRFPQLEEIIDLPTLGNQKHDTYCKNDDSDNHTMP